MALKIKIKIYCFFVLIFTSSFIFLTFTNYYSQKITAKTYHQLVKHNILIGEYRSLYHSFSQISDKNLISISLLIDNNQVLAKKN